MKHFLTPVLLLALSSCDLKTADAEPVDQLKPADGDDVLRHATTIHIPERLSAIELGASTDGRNQHVRCETCHGLRTDAVLPNAMSELDQFHQGMTLRHGELACAACHAVSQPPLLHLADGRTIATRDALQLCAQCHGAQYRDYQHGAHGGMNGYWDLSKGPRIRNHCIDCHNPHTPAIIPVKPVLMPRDRFFGGEGTH